jgi:glycosyltransferase involved in cell wall biosynthesis
LGGSKKVHLDVIGCTHDLDDEARQFVTLHGMIDKNVPSNRDKIAEMFAKAHFNVLMSRYECCAHALIEASAFGVPSVSTNTGGIPSAVIDGVNGCLFGLDAPSRQIAEYISEKFLNQNDYLALARSSYKHYQQNQSWDVSAEKVVAIIKNMI